MLLSHTLHEPLPLYINAKVYLNVYDLKTWLNYCQCLGLGAYHTAVEINGVQYFYWGTGAPASGILQIAPEGMKQFRFSRKIEMGEIYMGLREFNEILDDIRRRFIGSKYDLLSRNCNHFSEALVERLLGVKLPRYLFRVSDFLEKMRCVIPDCLLGPNNVDPFEKLNRRMRGLPVYEEDIKIVNF